MCWDSTTKTRLAIFAKWNIFIAHTNRYVVFLKDKSETNETMMQTAERLLNLPSNSENEIIQVYGKALNGFSAKLDDTTAQELKYNPEVKLLEKDEIVSLDSIQSKQYIYKYTGNATHSYVIDSGINYNHNEFKGRIGNGIDFVNNDNIADDCSGHGTHVSGIITGTKYGVAKEAIIHPVKILNCGGTIQNLAFVSAIDWILDNYTKPAVVNISISS